MSLFYEDPDVKLYHGEALNVLAGLPERSVHCVVTSPPYFRLRSYDDAPGQLGLEKTPSEYVDRLCNVLDATTRVLRDDGVIWLNIADSYASQGGGKEAGAYVDKRASGATWQPPRTAPDGYKPKDLYGIPWLVALEARRRGLYLRADIIWNPSNAMPESVTDRPTIAHEYVFLFSKSARYYYDASAVIEPATSGESFGRGATGRGRNASALASAGPDGQPHQDHSGWLGGDGKTRNLRSVWTFPSVPTSDGHHATFPEKLPETCILAGCPEQGTVLDPFVGSGTTCKVARRLGRRSIGIDLSAAYLGDIATKKLAQQSLFAQPEAHHP